MAIRKKRRRILYILSAVVIALFVAMLFGYRYINTPFIPKSIKEKAVLFIDDDDNIDSVYIKLEAMTQQELSDVFKYFVEYRDYADNILPGKYTFTSSDTDISVVNKLSRGHQSPSRLVFNNLRTKEQLAGRLDPQLMIDSLDIIQVLNDSVFLSTFGHTTETIVEFFIPNTYEVYWNMSAKDLVHRFKKEHARFWNKERLAKADSIGLSTLEISIIASIVEEETNVADEKPVVAGLYINRLKRNIPLQADPTVKFALQDFAIKRVLEKDTKIDSPYNTYVYAGLPPGPIRLASQAGLESVLNYTDHNYLYMCAKEDFSGRHNFATNLSDHINNSRRYWRALNNRKIYR